MDFDPDQPWYHGSPLKLTALREGSTITQKRDLARIFSHKPTIVSISDDGQIKHNGTMPGYLYTISEDVGPGDGIPHPRTTMSPGYEWLTTRELRVQLLCAAELAPEDQLTDDELSAIEEYLIARRGQRER